MKKMYSLTLLMPVLLAFTATKAPAQPIPPPIDPNNFVRGINNEFFPLVPGTTFFYEGTKEGVPTSNTFEVTRQTKMILGVSTILVRDRSYADGVLVEDTLDWFAQDRKGNVWYFGEDSKTFDPDGHVIISTAGSWQAGVNGARAGIIMQGHPRVRQFYYQEYAVDVAEDVARVLSVDVSAHLGADISTGWHDELLLTGEWTRLNPGELSHKYYEEGVGLILGMNVEGPNERTELVRITRG